MLGRGVLRLFRSEKNINVVEKPNDYKNILERIKLGTEMVESIAFTAPSARLINWGKSYRILN